MAKKLSTLILVLDPVEMHAGTVDPSAGAGIAAPVGSYYWRTDASQWRKTGAANTAWTNLAGALTPASLGGGSTNDYNPTGLASVSFIRQDLTASSVLNGIVATVERTLTIVNISAAFTLTFANENVGSAAANRFVLPNGLNWIIPPGGSISFFYDTVSSRWRCVNFSSNVFPSGTLASPGLVIGVTSGRGFRDAGPTLAVVDAGADRAEFSTGSTFAGALSQSGGQVNFSTGTAGFINAGPFSTSTIILATGDISPTALNGVQQDNYTPTGFSAASCIRQDLSAATTISGLGVGSDGKIITIHNIATVLTRDITLTHEDGASVAANRFNLPAQVSLIIPVGGAVTLRYDSTSTRWRVIS